MKFADGWAAIFDAMKIVEQIDANGFCDVTATDIKKHTDNLEPRLMSKIDFRENLPDAMQKSGCALLAIANGTYRIGRFDPFIAVDEVIRTKVETVPFPDRYLTLSREKLAHESTLLDVAAAAGILDKVFGEQTALTIRGRTRFDRFDFALNGVPFPVDGVQVEVDGGYEGATSINLVEAKIGARGNISLRQLLYPQLGWSARVAGRKTVRSFLCFYQEPVLRFIPIIFDGSACRADHNNERAFAFDAQASLNLNAIALKATDALPVRDAPFPQANDFDKVLAVLAVAAQNPEGISKNDLFDDFDLDARQYDYYANVLRWLGLAVIPRGGVVRMTPLGKRIAAMPHEERMFELADIIFREPVFHDALHNGLGGTVQAIMDHWPCNDVTANRRLGTVDAWIRYFRALEKR